MLYLKYMKISLSQVLELKIDLKKNLIKEAFKFHAKGNILEAKKFYQHFIDLGFQIPKFTPTTALFVKR